MTDTKIEEKNRYFLRFHDSHPKIFDFTISVEQFEELLKYFLENNKNIVPGRNGFKIYGINNKFFKIYQDGSCFGFNIKSKEIKQMEKYSNIYLQKVVQQQIFNDDFPGLKTYWVEEVYEEIMFKLDEHAVLVFSKVLDIPRNIEQYSIFLEQKDTNFIFENYLNVFDQLAGFFGTTAEYFAAKA